MVKTDLYREIMVSIVTIHIMLPIFFQYGMSVKMGNYEKWIVNLNSITDENAKTLYNSWGYKM